MKAKRLFTLFAVMTMLVGLIPLTASAEENAIKNIAVLGDSISAGYGLDEDENSYSRWLGDYYSADVHIFANSGDTTGELMDIIENDEDARSAIKKSDLICVSIGGNDVLGLFLDGIATARDSIGSSSGGFFGISSETIENIVVSISTAIGPAAVDAGRNLDTISKMLRELNPDGRIVMQTVYNPFETDDEYLKPAVSALYTFGSIYLSVINNALKSCKGIMAADIQKKFRGHCTEFTNINRIDIHPNAAGHFVIAEEIAQIVGVEGDGDVFARGLELLGPLPDDITSETELLAQGIFRDGVPKPTEPLTAAPKPTTTTTTTAATARPTTPEPTGTWRRDPEEKPASKLPVVLAIAATAAAAVWVAAVIIRSNRNGDT